MQFKTIKQRVESFLDLVLAVYFVLFGHFWSFCLALCFSFCLFSLGFLFSSLFSLVFAHPIFSLHFLLYSLLFFSQKLPHFHHLLIRFIHLYQVVSRSFILDLEFIQLIQNIFSVFFGNFVGKYLALNLLLLFGYIGGQLDLRCAIDMVMDGDFLFLEIGIISDGSSFAITNEISFSEEDKLLSLLNKFIFVIDLFFTEIFGKFFNHFFTIYYDCCKVREIGNGNINQLQYVQQNLNGDK